MGYQCSARAHAPTRASTTLILSPTRSCRQSRSRYGTHGRPAARRVGERRSGRMAGARASQWTVPTMLTRAPDHERETWRAETGPDGTALAYAGSGRPTDRSPCWVESSISSVPVETRDEVRKACRYPVRVAARAHAWRRSDDFWGRHEPVPPFLERTQLRSSSPKLQNASCFWSFWLSAPPASLGLGVHRAPLFTARTIPTSCSPRALHLILLTPAPSGCQRIRHGVLSVRSFMDRFPSRAMTIGLFRGARAMTTPTPASFR